MTFAEIPTAFAVEEEEFNESEIVNISENMKRCYSLSIAVKWFSWIDFIFSTLIAFGNMYFFIPVFLSFTGYLGAKGFNKKYIIFKK